MEAKPQAKNQNGHAHASSKQLPTLLYIHTSKSPYQVNPTLIFLLYIYINLPLPTMPQNITTMSQTTDQTTVDISPKNSPLPISQDQQQQQQQQQEAEEQQQRQHHRGWEGNESSTLLVVATLITALTYQIGSNPPGGFWQDDINGHEAGAPIMRDKHRKRYWLFMTAAWVGFGDSMLLTLWLLTGAPVRSRRVRWSFVVAYSSLQLTYITAMHGTSLVMDLLTWAGIMFVLFLVIGIEKRERNKLGLRCLSFFTERRLVNPSSS